MNEPLRVVVAGSRAIPSGEVGRLLVGFLTGLPPGTTVLLREGKYREPGEFERMIAMVCDLLGVKTEWRQVEITKELVGRRAVFARDLMMVTDADLTLCVTTIAQSYDMECGTTALAQKALSTDSAVYHYAITELAPHRLVRVGEHDPGHKFEKLVPVG